MPRSRACALFTLLTTLALSTAAFASGPCAPDLDGDGSIAFTDLLAVLSSWGPCGACAADLDGDGTVGFTDVLAVLSAWGPCPEVGTFPAMWINGGPNCGSEPSIQVHQFNDDMYILRQSLCTDFEGPFMYLIFGEDKVFMQDTGAGGIAIADTVYGIIDDWLITNGKTSIELIVTHSHGHGDHTNGDSQFNGQPNTTVVGTSQSSVANFFGISPWPTDQAEYDLGGRVLDILAIPGHHSAHIAVYDRQTGILLTGDTLYPGRLYISQFNTYRTSIQRMVDFLATRPCSWVLGTHIEMSNTPGEDYNFGATYHPDEHPLQLTPAHLQELLDAVNGMQGNPQIEVHDDFIVYPL